MNLVKKNLINSASHITGGGLVENILRSVPSNLSINIDLSKIKIKKIFKWIKSNHISDEEMLKTFNCGIGFCLIVDEKKIKQITKYFTKDFMPYKIGFISKSQKKINLINSLSW